METNNFLHRKYNVSDGKKNIYTYLIICALKMFFSLWKSVPSQIRGHNNLV